jgi:hypothetical protein
MTSREPEEKGESGAKYADEAPVRGPIEIVEACRSPQAMDFNSRPSGIRPSTYGTGR